MKAKEIISKILDLDNKIDDLRNNFDELPEKEKTEALKTLLSKLWGEVGESDPIPFSLVRTTDMVCGLEKESAAILSEGLSHENEDVRHFSGEALLSVLDGDAALTASAVDMIIKLGGRAAKEMPFLLTMSDDPDVANHITKFLGHKDPHVALAAIEALAEVGDPTCIPALKEVLKDDRVVTLDDMDDEKPEEWTLGKLAEEAIEMLNLDEEE